MVLKTQIQVTQRTPVETIIKSNINENVYTNSPMEQKNSSRKNMKLKLIVNRIR